MVSTPTSTEGAADNVAHAAGYSDRTTNFSDAGARSQHLSSHLELTWSSSSPDSIRPTLDQLAELATLNDDWDSYGGAPPTAQALNAAHAFLLTLQALFIGQPQINVHPNLVAPLADGGVHLKWSSSVAEIEVEFGPTGTLSYLFVEHPGTEETYVEEDDAPWEKVLALVAKILLLRR